MSKKCQLAYDYYFIARSDDKTVPDIDITLTFTIINKKTNTPLLFDIEPVKNGDQKFEYKSGQKVWVNHFYDCRINKNAPNGYEIIPDKQYHNDSDYYVTYTIHSITKWIDALTPVTITHAECIDLFKTHMDAFDHSDNKNAQGLSYSIVPITA